MSNTQIPNLQALTVLEPYATSIIYGNKRIEMRSYQLEIPNGEGIWLAIHAGGSTRLLDPEICATIRFTRWSELPSEDHLRENCGKILGLAKFIACLKAEEIPDDEVWKDHFDENKQLYCWLISEVKPLSIPINCRGNQRVWRLNQNLIQQIMNDVGPFS
ncbi:11639_t:CDS:1 [Ambispora leptoticha]|uniref:11639_t:CDS:1 n=1 Tax=Ambispora leptoticha TaxID=144679 RepID=A0A9N9N6N2_9GLOM|nr:11639_t:CDS:1 [Ambispora leptoticha]